MTSGDTTSGDMTSDKTNAMTLRPIPDETLMALADGELGRADAAALRARIVTDPALAERFALFAETRAMLEPDDSGADLAQDPGFDRLAAAIHTADRGVSGSERPAERRFTVVEGGGSAAPAPQTARRPAMSFRVAAPALAASLALMVGGLLGYGVGRQDGPPEAGGIVAVANAPAAAEAVARALAASASGEALAWSDPGSGLKGAVTVVSTHKMGGDRFCREYEVTVDGRNERSVALGCRGAGDQWRTELVARAPAGDGYAKASGGTVAESALIDLGSTGALSEDEEAEQIKGAWAGK